MKIPRIKKVLIVGNQSFDPNPPPPSDFTTLKRRKHVLVTGNRVEKIEETGNGLWQFPEPMGGDAFVGFVYVMENPVDGKYYIGKKSYRSNKGVPAKWRNYISSSQKVKADVARLGRFAFNYYCLEQYRFKGSLGFAETWSMCHVEAPYYKDKFYTALVNKVSWISKEPISERHKYRLHEIVNGRGLTLGFL